MQKLKIPFIGFSILLLAIPVATSRAGYVILSDAVSSSGCGAQSSNYLLGVTIGQTVIGKSSSGSYIETAGFRHWGMPPSCPVGVRNEPGLDLPLPEEYSLFQNYPNPFNPVTTIAYSLPEAVHVRLEIYNVLGQRVRTVVDEPQLAGYKTVQWNGRDAHEQEMAGGIYFYRLEAGTYSSSKKLLLLK